MTTARGIIKSALRKIGALTKFDDLSNDEAVDGLETLNQMLGSWSNDGLIVFARSWENFNLTGGDGEYTIGAGDDFNTARPNHIIEAFVRSDVTDYPLVIVNDSDYYAKIIDKTSQGIPDYLSYDTQFPSGKIRLWPVPSSSLGLHLLSEKAFSTYALDDTISLPPGYESAIIYNLAIYYGPEYGQPISGEVAMLAADTLAAIKRNNARNRPILWQPGTLGEYNVLTGWA